MPGLARELASWKQSNEPDAAQTAVLHGAIVHDSSVIDSTDGASRSDTDHLYLQWEAPHPIGTTQLLIKEGTTMNENNRVLSRQNARELTPAEVEHVVGNINTLTICSSMPSTGTKDCDTVG